mgnify:CR=1 FL=1
MRSPGCFEIRSEVEEVVDLLCAGLFDGKAVMFCDAEESDIRALAVIRRMYEALNMRVTYMDSSSHDRHAAFVSHISHISSFVLANAVLEKEKSTNTIFNLASGGFASTVRLAKSSPQMWSQIFEQNRDNLLEVMDTYIKHFQHWRELIETENFEKLETAMSDANAIKRILDK